MDTFRNAINYISHQGRAEEERDCLFCNWQKVGNIVYQDADVVAFDDHRPAGRIHWLVVPTTHIRDVESLTSEHVQLLEKFEAVKLFLLQQQNPPIEFSSIHCGFHRARRPMFGGLSWPDIISVQHLHMHIIVEPRWGLKWFKYPPYLSVLWRSDREVMRLVKDMQKRPASVPT